MPMAKNEEADRIMTRGSSLRDSMPATGAVRNMQTPVTNIVSPICSDV